MNSIARRTLTLAISVPFFASLACLGLSEGQILQGGVDTGKRALTADAATQQALETEIASGTRPPVVDISNIELTGHTCAPHPNTTDGFDCSYTVEFNVAYETPDFARVQCFFSRTESEKVNVQPGASQLTIAVTRDDLVYSPGTSFGMLCQLRDLASDELLIQDSTDLAVPAP
jgi:hypothetical protein